MKKTKTSSKLHVVFVIMILASLAILIAALCLFDYKFDVTFVQSFQANLPFYILACAYAAIMLSLIISAIALKVKNDELTRDEVGLSFLISIVLVLEVVLCVPIFISWIIQKIQDVISYRKHETI